MTRHRTSVVYLASSVSTYSTRRYGAMVKKASKHGAVRPAKDMFTCNADWLAAYRKRIDECTVVIFFTTEDGWVGRGVMTEIQYAQERGIPVHRILDSGEIVAWSKCRVSARQPGNWREYVRFSASAPRRATKARAA